MAHDLSPHRSTRTPATHARLRGRAWMRIALLAATLAVSSTGSAGPATLAAAELDIGGAHIDIDFAPGSLDVPRQSVLDWVATAARAVTHYYGRFPVSRYHVHIVPRAGSRDIGGSTRGGAPGAARSRITLGSNVDAATLADAWVMTHEMVHLAFPLMQRRHHWIEEGLATYVEPIARVQIGTLPVTEVWRQLVEGLPKGEPAVGDRGLDRTHTWGRTYWGGALFCLRADIAIRRATGNRLGLRDALRGLLAAGGGIEQEWPLDRALAVADRAVGVDVLEQLYAHMRDAPDPVDLDALWRELGVTSRDGHLVFDDVAPLAAVRRRIAAPETAAPPAR
jgi:hypothetical protein